MLIVYNIYFFLLDRRFIHYTTLGELRVVFDFASDLVLNAGLVSQRFSRQMSVKEILKFRVHQILFDWQCCNCWQRFAHLVELFIMDAFVDLFITLCIVLNTAFMALDHAGMSDHMAYVLTIGNYVCFSLYYNTKTHLEIESVAVEMNANPKHAAVFFPINRHTQKS